MVCGPKSPMCGIFPQLSPLDQQVGGRNEEVKTPLSDCMHFYNSAKDLPVAFRVRQYYTANSCERTALLVLHELASVKEPLTLNCRIHHCRRKLSCVFLFILACWPAPGVLPQPWPSDPGLPALPAWLRHAAGGHCLRCHAWTWLRPTRSILGFGLSQHRRPDLEGSAGRVT